MFNGPETSPRKEATSPAKTACIYISSIILVVTVLSSLSLLRFIISICHYEYTTGRTVCSPQNVALEKIPVEIPSRTLFLRIGGSEFYGSLEIFNASKNEDCEEIGSSTIEHSLTLLDSSNFSRFKNLRELTLFRCGIEEISENTFADLHKLRKLSLRNNRLVCLQERAFSGLVNLLLLDLSNNPLVALGNHVFIGSHITSLRMINVANLANIEPDAFVNATIESLILEGASLSRISSEHISPLKDSLKMLSMIHNLKSLWIDERAFDGFNLLNKLNLTNASLLQALFLRHANVDEIILDDNAFENGTIQFLDEKYYNVTTKYLSISNANLSKIPAVISKLYQQLQTLNLSRNRITQIHSENFCDLGQLNQLDLSSNTISIIDENITDHLPALSHLYMHSNFLNFLHPKLEKLLCRLQVVTISDNPLHCNCNFKWFADWLKTIAINESKEISEDLEKLNCSVPVNINILEADNSIFLCSPPKIEQKFFTEPSSDDVVIFECLVTGDPPPQITWESITKEQSINQALVDEALPKLQETPFVLKKRVNVENTSYEVQFSAASALYVARSTLVVAKPGNYTCIGMNSMGNVSHTFDTNILSISKKQFQIEQPKKVELLTSLEGAVVASLLLLIIGYLIKRES